MWRWCGSSGAEWAAESCTPDESPGHNSWTLLSERSTCWWILWDFDHMLTWDNSRRPFTSLNNDCRTSPNTGLTHDLHRKWQSIVQSPSWSIKRMNYVNFPHNERFYLWRSFRNGCKRFFTCWNFSQQDNTQEELVTCWHKQQFCNKLWLSNGAFWDLALWF